MRRHGDTVTRRSGDGVTRRHGDAGIFAVSFAVSFAVRLPISASAIPGIAHLEERRGTGSSRQASEAGKQVFGSYC